MNRKWFLKNSYYGKGDSRIEVIGPDPWWNDNYPDDLEIEVIETSGNYVIYKSFFESICKLNAENIPEWLVRYREDMKRLLS